MHRLAACMHTVMACIVMAYVVMVDVVMVCTVAAYIVMAYVVMADVVIAYKVMAYIVMADVVMVCTVAERLTACMHAVHTQHTHAPYARTHFAAPRRIAPHCTGPHR